MDLIEILDLGQNIQFLRRILFNIINKNVVYPLNEDNILLDQLEKLLDRLDKLKISIDSQKEIREYIQKYQTNYTISSEKNMISKKDANYLIEKITKWRDRIQIELKNIIVIEPYTEGSLNYEKLFKGIEYNFEASTWENLSDLNKQDLEDFRLCYFSKAWTPAGFMLMRVVESALRKYYKDITGNEETGWGRIIIKLRVILRDKSRGHSNIDSDLVDKLDYLRANIRNDLAHPSDILNAREVEIIFITVQEILPKIYG